MKRTFAGGILAASLLLSGCVSLDRPPFQPGATEAEIISKVGKPTARYKDGDTVFLEYAGGFGGQTTHMGKLGPDGRLVSWEQVLTVEKFDTLKLGKSTKRDVLLTVGQPGEENWIMMHGYEVWTYHYQMDGVWDDVRYLMFDKNGVLQKMEEGLDPLYMGGD
ncbi:MAG: hypothetical protein LBM56_03900 [Burkholderiaceae bacterium]|nr:hypothetical protein [Burkholderiaceae bacterium]